MHYARLKVGDFDHTIAVDESDIYANFEVQLQASKGIHISTWLLDKDQKELSGAYYATILRK